MGNWKYRLNTIQRNGKLKVNRLNICTKETMRKYRNIQNKKLQTYKVLKFRHIKF